MYIGTIPYDKNLAFTHVDSPIPFPPTLNEEGAYLWKLDRIFDMSVDVTLVLERECFVGAVNFRTGKAALAGRVLFGEKIGRRKLVGFLIGLGAITIIGLL
jgi:hypothetical protein